MTSSSSALLTENVGCCCSGWDPGPPPVQPEAGQGGPPGTGPGTGTRLSSLQAVTQGG